MKPFVSVIGTTFIDVKGFSRHDYNPLGRNLGSIEFVHGGVGRNVAENLAMLGINTYFVSSVDRSALGSEVAERLKKTRVKLDFLSYAESCGMGMWLAILDRNGDLAGSISQMPELSILEDIIAKRGRKIMEASGHIVLEIDLNSSISRKVVELAREHEKKVYGIPGNLEVILSDRDLLKWTDCFICNDIEAGRLIGKDIAGIEPEDLVSLLVRFVSLEGIPSMVITLGPRGSVYYDSRTSEAGYQPACPTKLVDSSGAGDAFFSGTVMGLVNNRPLKEAVQYGTRVASWTIQVEENTCPDLPFRVREDSLFKNVIAGGDNKINMAVV
ncbi:MAG: carbohydrate kinase family protein [Bacillota bacterium]